MAIVGDHLRYQTIIEVYDKNVKQEIKKIPNDWMYSWIYADLKEWELVEQFKYGLSTHNAQPDDSHILKIRGKLAELQTQMVRNLRHILSTSY